MGNTWSVLVPVAMGLWRLFSSPPTQPRHIDQNVAERIQSKLESDAAESQQQQESKSESERLERLKAEAARVDAELRLKRVEAEMQSKLKLESERVEGERVKMDAELKRKRDEIEMQEKKKSDLEEAVKLEEAKLQSRRDERYATRAKVDVEALRRLAHKAIGIDCAKINLSIVGQRGVGKSSTINGLRGMNALDKGAAEVGVHETTMKIQQYTFPGADHWIIWDVPGSGTLNHSGSTYFLDKYLFAFDYLLIVFTSCLGEVEIDLIKQAIAYHVPFAIVRNMANLDLQRLRKENREYARMTKDEGKRKLIGEHRQDIDDCLRKAEIDPKRAEIFVINAWAFTDKDETAFEEGELIDHIMNKVAEDRYGQRPSTTT